MDDVRPTAIAGVEGPRTLAIDVGGTGLKASIIDDEGATVRQHGSKFGNDDDPVRVAYFP